MKITTLDYAKSTLPESMIFTFGEKNKSRDIAFKVFLIKENEKLILVDAGCETMPGFDMVNFIGPVTALKNIGISPKEITDVIITHAHHDHIECVKYFENAVIHIQKDEYKYGKTYIPSKFNLNLFDNEFYITKNVKVINIGGHSVGSCIVEIYDGEKIYVVSGDECYLRENLTQKIPTGSSFNKQKSEQFILKYSDTKYEVLLCHDN